MTINIDINRKTIDGTLNIERKGEEWLFADTVKVVDDNGFNWTSDKLNFSRRNKMESRLDVNFNRTEKSICYETINLRLTDKNVKDVVNSIINGKGCIIRLSGTKGNSDIVVNNLQHELVKETYGAYNALAKTFMDR